MPNDKSVLLKYDGGKVRYDLVDPTFYKGLADVLTYGANKYAAYNWCKPIDDIGRLYAALQRHIQATRMGVLVDNESRLRHIHHAAANLMFIDYHTRRGIKSAFPRWVP